MREPGRRRHEIGPRKLARAEFSPGKLQPRYRARNPNRESAHARLEWIGLAVGVEKYVLRRQSGRRFAIVDCGRLVTVSAIDQHESAAAEIAGARQRHRE